jgi:hypothetical protein
VLLHFLSYFYHLRRELFHVIINCSKYFQVLGLKSYTCALNTEWLARIDDVMKPTDLKVARE